MGKARYDGVIEAVHYNQDGHIEWVRAYLRRGSTWSDLILLDREALVNQIKVGKRFVAGERVRLMAGTFIVRSTIQVDDHAGQELLVTSGVKNPYQDSLENIPIL